MSSDDKLNHMHFSAKVLSMIYDVCVQIFTHTAISGTSKQKNHKN